MNKLISSTWEINGEIVIINGSGDAAVQIPQDPIDYADDGWSVEMRHGCVRNRRVDEYLAVLAGGDKYQREAAEKSPRWFAVFVNGRDYDDATRKLLIRNYQQNNASMTFVSGWGGAMSMEPFYSRIGRDMTVTQPPFSYSYEDELADHGTPIYGFDLYAIEAKFVDMCIQYLDRLAGSIRFRAENPNQPIPIQIG